MPRSNSRGIQRRAVAETRATAPEQYQVQTSGAEAQSYSAVSQVTASVLGRLSAAANGVVQQRAVQQNREDSVAGQAKRTQETVEGTAAQSKDALSSYTPAFRRGYYVSEAANRLSETRLSLTKQLAQMEPGDDPQPIIEQTMGGLLKQKEFQDPQVMAQLQPAIQQMREQVLQVHAKSEVAELLERQSENMTSLARTWVQDGSLRSPEGRTKFREMLNTEQFAYLDHDDADDIISAAYVDLIQSGEVDVTSATEALKQTSDGESVPLWDRKNKNGSSWADQFTTAAKAGAAIQRKAYEEKQATIQASFESEYQAAASYGRLSDAKINATAGRLGLVGTDRLSFVRHWIDQNQAGIRRLEQEAKEAARHREVIATLNAGNGLTLETARLEKSAGAEWTAAVKSGDPKAQAGVIARYTKYGVVIPALKDLIGRTTAGNLTQNYATYKAIADVDPIVAARYVSDDNAVLFQEYHENRATFGMSDQEALAAIQRPEQKAVRSEVSTRIGRAATAFFKKTDEMPDGTPLPPWMQARVQNEATRLAMRNPMAPPEVAISAAFARVKGDMTKVNGRWVARGGMRSGAEPGVDLFVKRAAQEAVRQGIIPSTAVDKVYAAPAQDDPNVFILLRGDQGSDGMPIMSKDKVPRPVVFDPRQTAARVQQWQRDEAEKQARFDQEHKPKNTVFGIDPAAAVAQRTAKGDPTRKPSVQKLGDKAPEFNQAERPASTDLLDYLSTFKD
ncbi:hypothetical protein [Xanthomonas tesorieronis]|uniref:hypothetical protein n=1 Tax=Xanthomonas tesorieronis TaxID=3160839 RepID=UPI003514FE8E